MLTVDNEATECVRLSAFMWDMGTVALRRFGVRVV
jgi:hypothetical protein